MTIEQTTSLIVKTIDADASRGGWQATCVNYNAQADIEYGRHVEIFNRSEGGGTWEDDFRLALDGSMMPQSMQFSRSKSSVQLVVSTADAFLENAGLQGIYFSEQAAPANPHQMTDLRLGRIVKHILEEHTNVTTATPGGWVDTSRIEIVQSTSVNVYTVKGSNSIWATIADIASNEFYVRYFTKYDQMVYEQHPQFKALLPDVTFTATESNMLTAPEIVFRDWVKTDQVQLYALTDSGNILTKDYPANIGTDGRRQKFANLRCNTQARLDLLAERAYKFLNRQYDVRIRLAGPWGVYLELYDRIAVTYSGTAQNGVSISWSEKKFWIEKITVTKGPANTAVTELYLQEENV